MFTLFFCVWLLLAKRLEKIECTEQRGSREIFIHRKQCSTSWMQFRCKRFIIQDFWKKKPLTTFIVASVNDKGREKSIRLRKWGQGTCVPAYKLKQYIDFWVKIVPNIFTYLISYRFYILSVLLRKILRELNVWSVMQVHILHVLNTLYN